jgi:hypothetical protein
MMETQLRMHGAVDMVDNAGRMPSNMSYSSFVTNSKKWAAAAGRVCELPEIVIPVGADASPAAVKHALAEVNRLMHEGEPIMIRNVIPFLEAAEATDAAAKAANTGAAPGAPKAAPQAGARGRTASRKYRTAAEFVADHPDLPVRAATARCALSAEIYTRGCHWIPRKLASS